jgi:very-short-patch-repair endonuclease
VLRPHRLERAVNEAEVLRLTDPLSVPDLLARYPRRRGSRALRRALAAAGAPTRSELEARFLALLDRHGLPRPRVNARLQAGGEWMEVDCVWEDARVIVELDGYAAHGTRAAFERDRERDRALLAAGWRVLRITWRQLHDRPGRLAAELRALGI